MLSKRGCGYVPIDTSVPSERVNMIINKVQPDIIFNTSDTQLNHSNIQELTIQSIQDSDNPTLFDSQMGLTDVVYTILHLVQQVSLKVFRSNMQV